LEHGFGISQKQGKMMIDKPFKPSSCITLWGRVLTGALAVTGLSMVVSGMTLSPTIGQQAPIILAAAQAQDSDISSDQITSYAASVLEMDPYRTEAYTKIKNLLSDIEHDMSAVDLSCAGSANLSQLPRNLRSEVRTIIVDYCNRASRIVQNNGLTVTQFNAITAAYPQDPGLAEQIRTALIQIQQQSAPDAEAAPAE
jgi:hypothetical protein